jgi:hypothetical protein
MVFRRTHLILCGTLLAAGLTSSTSFAVSDEERAGARAAANQGADAFDQGKWAEAAELFGRAEALVHSPIHLSYIARAQMKLGHWVEAYELFNRIKREPLTPPISTPVANAVADANHQLSVLDAQLPYVTINVKGGDGKGVTVTMDGVVVPSALLGVLHPVNPGAHKFRASSATESSNDVNMDFKPSVRQTVDLVLTPSTAALPAAVPVAAPIGTAATPVAASSEPPPVSPAAPDSDSSSPGSGLRAGGYVALGVGVVGVGLGTVFLISAGSKQKKGDDAFSACQNRGCSTSEQGEIDGFDKDAASGKTLALTSFIVGGIGAATGITLLLLAGNSKAAEAPATAHVEPYVGYRTLGLTGRF